ncbi:MAG TPA: hypothetical protein VMB77_12465 [Syntrophales bacterium]|nr:hypothetical protein [Syntrophales bacterium]
MDFVREFLFGKTGIVRDGAGVRAEIAMDLRTEGWIGIPHGGISMGAVVDLFESLHEGHGNQGVPYPITLNVRMGGSRLRTGERVEIAVTPEGEGAKAIVSVQGSTLPYLKADISKGPERSTPETIACLPSSFEQMEGSLSALPFYRNCFVCGVKRHHPGLKRKFQLFEAARPNRVVVSCAGFDVEDRNTVYRFERNGWIHPVVLLALVDETMGWAGFMNYASGGVTVHMSATLHRRIDVAEKLVVFGRGEKVRRANSRMLIWVLGGAAVVGKSGALEIVMTASSQFLGVPALTEQMRTELIPQELTRRAFQIAESQAYGR